MKKEVMMKLEKGVAGIAKRFAKNNVNATCSFAIYQPKLPKGADKLKKS